jgi:hypothetical protein
LEDKLDQSGYDARPSAFIKLSRRGEGRGYGRATLPHNSSFFLSGKFGPAER